MQRLTFGQGAAIDLRVWQFFVKLVSLSFSRTQLNRCLFSIASFIATILALQALNYAILKSGKSLIAHRMLCKRFGYGIGVQIAISRSNMAHPLFEQHRIGAASIILIRGVHSQPN